MKRPDSALDDGENVKPSSKRRDIELEASAKPPSSLAYPSTSQPVKKPPPFQQPSSLLTFSYTPDHVLEFTDSAMRYFVNPPPRADLRHGYERWIRNSDERGRLDNLLRAYSQVLSNPPTSSGNISAGVISWRGIMTK
jgi:RAT1-interacting protein